ncbi:hypothetical protein BCR35DRAFT_294926 [Leucosporidium creatinivorum]|uniref:GAF domain-containing protein n=1 Tax=Leucosporidium creatinivorum TaxID=106004 RepID=A0A1Y2E7E3_9BASI|nr:hypothetical protein BCR35DRAFT_294926 [Leucosporidium creatinivorum]
MGLAPQPSIASLAPPPSEGAFSYSRTANLSSSIRTQPSQTFPSRPPMGRNDSDTASISSTASSAYPARPFALPPGLSSSANTSSTSLRRPTGKPRSARVDFEPPLPAAAHWLLLTTPPPPPRARASSLLSVDHTITTYRSRDSQEDSLPKKSWGKKSLAALGLRGQQMPPSKKGSVASLRAPPTSASASYNQRAPPTKVQLQLGGGGIATPRASTSSRRGGRLDSRSDDFEIPRSWEEFATRYGQGEINIEDPCFPPIHSTSAQNARPSPYQEGSFAAPTSPLEHIRQKLLLRLDLLGKADLPASTLSTPTSPASAAMVPGSSASSRWTAASHRDSIFTNNRDSIVSTAPSTAPSPSIPFPSSAKANQHLYSSLPPARSLQNHPALLAILAKSRKLFGTKMTMITILEDQRQFFLASDGMPDKVDSLPRSATLCSHTVLNGERGLVVLDTQRDWRFRSNMLSVVLNARFYAGEPRLDSSGYGRRSLTRFSSAGMPLFAPSHPELEEEAGGRVPIGTIAIIDDNCRVNFSSAERAKLRSLATDVSNEIHNWVQGHWDRRSSVSSVSSINNRLKHVSFDSSSSYIDWQAKSGSVAPPPAASSGFVAQRRVPEAESLPPTPPGSIRRPSRAQAGEDDPGRSTSTLVPASRGLAPMPEESPSANIPSIRRTSTSDPTPRPHVFPSAPRPPPNVPVPSAPTSKSTFPSARTRPPPKSPQQKLFDAATGALGKGLDLSLVYLVSLDLSTEDQSLTPLTLLSAHNLPATKPSFDPSLHLKALRAPEGGLLFKNPLVASSADGSFEGPGYASGILLPVAESQELRKGWVLAGYTRDGSREFEEEELEYFTKVVEQLKKVVSWAIKAELEA